MTEIERILCTFCGGIFGYLIVYAWCKIWDFITMKRVEIPEIKYDVTDNPILTLKNRLGHAYVATYDRTAKELLHRLLEYVVWIDNWHKEQVLIVESKCNDYKRKAERLQAEFESECLKNAELEKQFKDAELRNEQLRQMLKLNIGKPLITPQEWKNILDKEPIPVETVNAAEEASEQATRMNTGAIIHIDSEDLNRYSTGRGPDGKILPRDIVHDSKEELAEKLRDFWGLEAQKAVEIATPDTDKKDEPPIYNEEFNQKLRNIWFGVDNDTECHKYSVTVRKNGKEEKIIVLARSSIEAANLVPSGYTVEGMSRLFD